MSELIVRNTTDQPDYIKITQKSTGNEYTLQFSRASALFAQQRGFNTDDISTKPGYVIPDLFYYAMRKNHGNMARDKVDKLREALFPDGLPIKVVQRLYELYEEACSVGVVDLSDEGEESKNADAEVEM